MIMLSYSRLTNAQSIEFPTCAQSEILNTEVHLYVDESVLAEYSKAFIASKIATWESYSNLVLKNSCIPMTRKVTKVTYTSAIDSLWFQDLSAAERLLKLSMEEPIKEITEDGHPVFKGIVFSNYNSSFESDYCGISSSVSYFFSLAINCPDYLMEHEIGHLSGANHDYKTLLKDSGSIESYISGSYPRAPQYSFGAICADRGTVMSYERDVIPAYSSPDIRVDGIKCGDSKHHNNARVLREFANTHLKLIDSNKN
nr:zinc-dependent metalloprotease [Vibrio crassostreae]